MDSQFDDLFQNSGEQYGIDPDLLKAQAYVESGLDPNAKNPDPHSTATGISQFIAKTAKSMNVDPSNPKSSIDGQARLLAENFARYGTPDAAIAAYNGGTDPGKWNSDYVKKVTDIYQDIKKHNPTITMKAPITAVTNSAAISDDYSNESNLLGLGDKAPTPGPANDFSHEIGLLGLDKVAETVPPKEIPTTVTPPAPMASPLVAPTPEPGGSTALQGLRDSYSPPGTRSSYTDFRDRVANAATFGLADKAGALGAAAGNATTNWLTNKPGTDFNADYQGALQDEKQRQQQFSQQHPIAAGIATGIGTFGGIAPVAGYTAPASLSGKMATGIGQGAVVGGLGGLGNASDQSFEGDVKDMTKGAGVGAILGGTLPVAFAAGKGAVNFLSGKGVSPEVAELAQTAQEKYGIPISGAQLSDSQFVKFLDSMTGKLPFSGETGRLAKQSQAVTDAISNEILPMEKSPGLIGKFATPNDLKVLQESTGLTPKYMQAAKSTLGSMFDRVADNTTIDTPSLNKLADKLAEVSKSASFELSDQEIKPISNQIDNILDKVQDNNTIPGSVYQSLTRKGTPLDRAMTSSNPNIRYYGQQIRGALDDALENSASGENLNLLRQARYGYKNLMTVKDIAAKAGVEGDINPNLLLNAVKKSYKDLPFSGGGNMGELARITQLMKEAPSSRTAERTTAMDLVKSVGRTLEGTGLGAGAGYALGASPMAALTGVGATLGGGKVTNLLLNSDWYRDRLLNAALSGPGPVSNFMNSSAGPGAAIIGANQLRNLNPP